MAKITGIGGVFFKGTGDNAALAARYQKHLGMRLEAFGGAILRWPEDLAQDKIRRTTPAKVVSNLHEIAGGRTQTGEGIGWRGVTLPSDRSEHGIRTLYCRLYCRE